MTPSPRTPTSPAPPAVTRSGARAGTALPMTLVPPFVRGRTLESAAHPGAATVPAADTGAAAPAGDVDAMPQAGGPAELEDEGWPMLEEEGAAMPAWDTHESPGEEMSDFPLDAFIIPEDARSVPAGVTEDHAEIAARVADRLEALVQRIRTEGLAAVTGQEPDELTDRVAAAIRQYFAS